MFNKTSALMLQTIMLVMEQQNATDHTADYSASTDAVEMERCYEPYGCFSIGSPWVTETRPVNLFPFPPKKINVRFPVFTRRNMRIPLVLDAGDANVVRHSNIDSRGPFYIISHGYMESGDKPWIEEMVVALLSQEAHAAAAVIVVDWRQGASARYTQAVANIRLVGAITAHLVHMLYEELGLSNLDNFHFIGHSLGAHLGGYCGHTLQEKFGLKLGRITGLDPAEPHFARTAPAVRLDRGDAHYVDVLHTDATSFTSGGLGISEAIGHADFFPHGGHNQPGCNVDMLSSIQAQQGSFWHGVQQFLSCNHVRSYKLFTESIAPACPFYTIQCDSYEDFLAGKCTRCDRAHLCLPLGFHSHAVYRRLQRARLVSSDTSLRTYSLTGDKPPFCRVHYRVSLKVSGAGSAQGEVGQLVLTVVDAFGNRSEPVPLDPIDGRYHEPGSVTTVMVSARGGGAAPASALLEWRHPLNYFNPFTWRLLTSPQIHIDWLTISSIEYNAEIKVCPEPKKPVVANIPHHFNSTNCAA